MSPPRATGHGRRGALDRNRRGHGPGVARCSRVPDCTGVARCTGVACCTGVASCTGVPDGPANGRGARGPGPLSDEVVATVDRPGISCATTPMIPATAATEAATVHRNVRWTRPNASSRRS